MPRLIDATEVVKAILAEREKIPRTIYAAPYELGIEKPYHAGDQMRGGIRKALRCIEQAPTVDAVHVVRCGQCEKRDKEFVSTEGTICCPYMEAFMPADGFCSYGERKEGAD